MKTQQKKHVTIWNHIIKTGIVGFLCSCSVLIQGCATTSSSSESSSIYKKIDDPGSVKIQLKGTKGDEISTRFYSHSLTKNFHQSQIVKKKDEIVEFSLIEIVKDSDLKKDRITIFVTSKDKDGVVDLHDLAFPEKDEVIEYVYASNGKVIKAGKYPKWSIFYIPPLPLPKGPVEVGDTWEMTEEWRSLNNGIPLQVSLVGILKAIYQCGNDRCADIELSGDVAILNAAEVKLNFVSEMHGRLIFNLDRGLSVWSMIQGHEDLRVNQDQTVVVSCLSSSLLEPKEMRWLKTPKANCEPTGEPVTHLP